MRVKVKLMEENGEEDGRWGDGYRFEKVVDAGWRAKRGIESFFNRMAGGGEGVSNVSFRNGETLLHFLSRQRVEIAWFLPQYIPFPVASIHFDYRHFLQLFYFRSLLIRRCEKKKKKKRCGRICADSWLIVYSVYRYSCTDRKKSIEKEEED